MKTIPLSAVCASVSFSPSHKLRNVLFFSYPVLVLCVSFRWEILIIIVVCTIHLGLVIYHPANSMAPISQRRNLKKISVSVING